MIPCTDVLIFPTALPKAFEISEPIFLAIATGIVVILAVIAKLLVIPPTGFSSSSWILEKSINSDNDALFLRASSPNLYDSSITFIDDFTLFTIPLIPSDSLCPTHDTAVGIKLITC